MKRQIPDSFKEHMKHKKGEEPMMNDGMMGKDMKEKKEPEKTGRAAKQFMHGHGRRPSERGGK